MKFEQMANKIFTNTYFLYAMVIFSALSILGYLLVNNLDAVVFFALVGVISVNFSKNMAVVLAICLLATNTLMANKIHEGMKSKKTDTEDTTTDDAKTDDTTTDDTTTDDTATDDAADKKKKMMIAKKMQDSKNDSSNSSDTSPMMGTDDAGDSFRPMREKEDVALDYGASIKNAYKDLNNILDPDAIKNLTAETMGLMQEQKKLMASMNGMQPLMQQAQELVQGFKSGGFANTAGAV